MSYALFFPKNEFSRLNPAREEGGGRGSDTGTIMNTISEALYRSLRKKIDGISREILDKVIELF